MSEPFDVGPWRVEPELLRVRQGDTTRSLAPKAMAVLEVLAAHRGQVVGRETIDRAVWQGDIVGEDVLRRTISDLRKVLDDNARAPRHIETVPRRGYRLLQDPEPTSKSAPESTIGPDLAGNRSWALPMAVAAAVGLALLAVLGVTLAPSPEPDVRPLWPSMPLTSAPGAEVHPALSRDGTRVAYVADRLGRGLVLQVQDLDAAAPLTIEPSIEGRPAFPTWSPDGRRLAWAEQTPTGWRLWVRPLLSDGAQLVAEISDQSLGGLAWSPTTDALAVVVRRPGRPSRIERFDLADGSWRPLTDPPSTSGGDTRPTWSPDGESLAVVRERVQGSQAIHQIDVATGSDRQLIAFAGKVPGLAWDGDVLVLNRFLPADRRGIWRLDPATGELDALPIGARFPTQLTAAAGRLVFVDGSFRGDLVVLDSAGGAPRPVASSTFWDGSPQLAPDGRRVAFASLRSGAAEIWVAGLDGAPPRRLTDLGATRGGFVSNPRWSPNGRALVFDARGRDSSHVFLVEVDAPGPARPLTEHPSDAVVPSWSVDGERILFASNRTGAWQVHSRAIAGGAVDQESRGGGFFAQEDPAGGLVWTRHHEAGLWRRDGDVERRWSEMPDPAFWGAWAVLVDRVIVAVRTPGGHEIVSVDRATGDRTMLATFDPSASSHGDLRLVGPSLGVGPDGSLVAGVAGPASSDLVSVVMP